MIYLRVIAKHRKMKLDYLALWLVRSPQHVVGAEVEGSVAKRGNYGCWTIYLFAQ
ncbi:hypothetical protein C9890_0434 [Perkinsus sp. BL_2016]|nr:hypothetical protein C9890_0434 [Perkinsus sp. BL_2016]